MASKKDLLEKIQSLKYRIREHEQKIRNDPNAREVSHWENEIREWERQVSELESQLNQAADEVTCWNCGRTVMVKGGKCPSCDARID